MQAEIKGFGWTGTERATAKVLFGVTLAYLIAGPLHTLYRLRRHRAERRAAGRGG